MAAGATQLVNLCTAIKVGVCTSTLFSPLQTDVSKTSDSARTGHLVLDTYETLQKSFVIGVLFTLSTTLNSSHN